MVQEPLGGSESIAQAARATVGSIRQLAADTAELAALEARRAGSAIAWLAGLGVGMAIAASAFWSLEAAALAVLIHQGPSRLALILALIGAMNLLLVLLIALLARRLARRLGFPALRRTLLEGAEARNRELAKHP